MSDFDLLVQMFEASEEASVTARGESEQARDYYDGKQLTSKQLAELKKRRQPAVIENLIRPKIDFLRGLERQSRTDPKAYPSTISRDDDAFAATDALRFVATSTGFDVKRSGVFENMMVEGFGGVEVGHKKVRGGVDPAVTRIAWDRLFYDPHSCDHDFSDASYKGFITWMDQDKALSHCKPGGKWAGKESVVKDTMAQPCSSQFATYDDKPRWSYWSDGKRKRLRVVTIYYEKDGIWNRAVYTLAGELEPCAPSPYLDEEGKPECALILESGFVDRDNDRYGIVRDLIPLQDEVNKRRSKFLHYANTRAVRVSPSSAQDAETIRKEASRPDGVIVADAGEVEFLPNNDLAAGQFNLLNDTRAAIKGAGPNAHLQGKAGDGQSGRAILALQQGGMTEMAPLLDNLAHFNKQVYRQIWCRVRQFWTAERWVRVTDDERNVRFVGLNTTKGQLALVKLKAALDAGQVDQPTARQYALQIQADPAMQQPANMVGEMDVDIDIEEVPNSPTLQIEQFEELVKLASMNPQAIPFEDIVRASNLREKEAIIKGIEDRKNAPAAPPGPEQELALRNAAAAAAEREAKASLYVVKAHNEAALPFLAGHEAGLAA